MSAISEIEIQGNRIVLDDVLAAEVNKWGHRLKGYIEGTQLVIVPAGEVLDAQYPMITRYEGVVGGEPVIAGTRVTVRAIVEYDRMFHDADRTLRAVPHLTIEQIQEALAYYRNHPSEIDAYIEVNDQAYDQGAAKP